MDDHAALLLLLKERLSTLIDAVPAAQSGDVKSVHQARVATRRLREALPVLRTSVDRRALGRVRRRVRKMTRALGPVRELDVALQHLDELAPRGLVSSRALARVRHRLARERLERRRDLLAIITPGRMEKLRHHLGQVATGEEIVDRPSALAEVDRQVGRRARRLGAAIQRAGGLYLPDRLHAVRVAAKKLRYALEVERELKRSRATARIAQLKRLQDLLGRMHDLEILIDRTRQVQTETAAADRRLATELDALIRALEDECRQLHAAYMRRRDSISQLCEQLTPAAEPRRPAVA